MKRHLLLVAVASLLASGVLAAQPPATAAPTVRIGIAYDTKDNCYTDSVAAGVARAASEYRLTVFEKYGSSPGAVLDNRLFTIQGVVGV